MTAILAIIILFSILFSWVSLVIVIAVGQNIADLSVPPWPETLWKLAVIAIVSNLIVVFLPLGPILSALILIVVFWTLMVKWFQVDFLGAIILSAISAVIRWALLGLINGLL
ncbi:MAG: hypothetical protein QGH94_02630 [Phycisphaerae bacterium]|jgi:hypothetical protein|nr:hypothetical protein [Phycisphaerae bacterium]MDP7286870.1 hypothetical protein [Phycisphaerae bacterium]